MLSELLRTLNQLPALVGYLDPDLRYRFANEAHRRWRGIDPASMIGRSFPELFAPLYPELKAAISEAFSGRRGTAELQIAPDGPFSFARVVFAPDLADDGSVRGIVAMATDLTERRELEARLRRSEQMFSDAFTCAVAGKAIGDAQGRLLEVNPALAAMLGYTVDELTGVDAHDINHPDDLEAAQLLFEELLRGERSSYQIETRFLRRDGSVLHGLLAVFAVPGLGGGAERFAAELVDLTEQVRARDELSATAARLTLASNAMDGGFWHYDIEQDRFETSPALTRFLTGEEGPPLDLSGLRGHILAEDVAAADLEPLRSGAVDRSIARYRIATASRGARWVKCQRQLMRDAAGRPIAIVGVATDITDEVERQQALIEQARTDRLTGLVNRLGFEERAASILYQSASDPDSCGLLIIDLDQFKLVNQRHGRAAGDAVLFETAQRLQARVGPGDVLCRLSGDRFALLVAKTDPWQLRALASRLVMDMDRPVSVDGKPVLVGASVGAIAGSLGGLGAMLSLAETQLRAAKEAGRGGWRFAA